MGTLDDALGSSANPAIPGGDLSKPLIVALLALLAARYTSGGPKEIPSSAGDNTATAAPTPKPLQVRSLVDLGVCSNNSNRMVSATWSIPGSALDLTTL